MDQMLTVCGFNQANRNSVINTEGLNDVNTLATLSQHDVETLCIGLTKLAVNRGGSFIGAIKQKNMKAMVWWAHDRTSQGLPVDPLQWDAATLASAIQLMDIEKEEKQNDENNVPIPTKFNAEDWSDDHFLFIQHLKSCPSSDGKRNLSYVGRDNRALDPTMSREERLIYAAPLAGPHFTIDNKAVYQKLRTWLNPHQVPMGYIRSYEPAENGRGALLALQQYFDGPSEISKQFVKATAEHKQLFYKNENALPYATFVSRFKRNNFIFDKAGQGRNARTQVQDFYDKLNNTDSQTLRTKIEVIRGDRTIIDNVDETINRIGEAVAETFPNPRKGPQRRYVSSTGRGRGRGRGRGTGRGKGKGRGQSSNRRNFTDAELAAKPGGRPGDKWNDVDISNLKASYAPSDFNSFPSWLKVKISKAKAGTDFSRHVNSATTSTGDLASVQSEIAQLRAVMQASVAPTDLPPPPQNIPAPDGDSTVATQSTAGTRFGQGAYGPNKRQKSS